ncbi:MAG: lysophospholipid acyltransferase family protein [Candidatus Zixiibacteriota bacterium]
MRPFYFCCIILVRMLARLIFRIKIYGSDKVPSEGAFILASNHISYYDPPLVGSFVKREVHFLAKRELFRNKLFGKLISSLNAHPLNRQGFDKKALELAERLLREGSGLIIFPEGTRAKQGKFLAPRPGIGMIAINSGAPVVPVYIHGANRLWRCFIGKEKLAIVYGAPMDKDETRRFEQDKEGYHRLAEEIMRRIDSLKEDLLKRSRKA